MLDDPVTAQYTHTLTVTGRLGRQYQCTVSNSKPSLDSASITVQGMYLSTCLVGCNISWYNCKYVTVCTQHHAQDITQCL